jgi:hypothetical protein
MPKALSYWKEPIDRNKVSEEASTHLRQQTPPLDVIKKAAKIAEAAKQQALQETSTSRARELEQSALPPERAEQLNKYRDGMQRYENTHKIFL